jgi:hypothetical protein
MCALSPGLQTGGEHSENALALEIPRRTPEVGRDLFPHNGKRFSLPHFDPTSSQRGCGPMSIARKPLPSWSA